MTAPRRALALGVAALAALAAGGCARGPGGAPGAPDADEEPRWSTSVVVPGEPEPTLVAPRPGMADVRPYAFARYRPHPDGRGIRVAYWGGVEPCFVLDHVEVEEEDDAVLVTLHAGTDPAAADVACIEIALSLAVDVRLSAPLGDRAVLDGAASRAPRPRY